MENPLLLIVLHSRGPVIVEIGNGDVQPAGSVIIEKGNGDVWVSAVQGYQSREN